MPEVPMAWTGPTNPTLFGAISLLLSFPFFTSPPRPNPKTQTKPINHHPPIPLSTPLYSSLSLLQNPFPIPPFPNYSTTPLLSPLGKPLDTPLGPSESIPVAEICTQPKHI
ncbi:hypothetical protein F2P56_016871 [Juglans regia]|uniref:Uncharacterized protein n=1 Tax=Juglans regia TaxID=51240 RepID=A0A833XIY5_JUGRE|nr:hypothetical protein F2P56_016871 [Juglans regia]